ncbi:MAG: SPOR domain-containing protein [Burkholderiaceae bacterium]|jgi:cell division protein FtsN|nr:SPOR domain-containing protein [Burkholderiaceae bacterium]
MKTQRGGTFLGLIVGIVIGLAVALGVAIYVAKVPVPFINKGATRTNGQDAAEAEKNRDWNPNALLRGKSAPAPAPAASGAPIPPPAEVEHSQAAENRRPPEGSAAAPAAQPARNPPASGDPLDDLVAARTRRNAAPEPAPAAADPTLYFVQTGAFRSPEEAESQRARLLLAGVQAQINERDQTGRPMYRVRVGPFQNRDAAERVRTRLAGEGFDAALAGVPR